MFKDCKLFKSNNFKSWSMTNSGNIRIKKDNPATNWDKYIELANDCSLEATGYVIKLYKRGQGIKGAEKLNFCNSLDYNGKISARRFNLSRMKAEGYGYKFSQAGNIKI